MKRAPETRIAGFLECRECKRDMNTLYTCSHEGKRTVEFVSIKCKCGYRYRSYSTYGKHE